MSGHDFRVSKSTRKGSERHLESFLYTRRNSVADSAHLHIMQNIIRNKLRYGHWDSNRVADKALQEMHMTNGEDLRQDQNEIATSRAHRL